MELVRGIFGFINKMTNKLFGKTHIFITLLGWVLIVTGVLMCWKPEQARHSLARRGFRLLKGYIFILALFLGVLLISETDKLNGLLKLAILIIGLVFLVKGYLFLKKTASDKINEWLGKVPLPYLRVYAAIQTVIGIAMLIFRKRIYF